MSLSNRGLGRGLDALLATSNSAQARTEQIQPSLHSPLQQLAISQLVAGIYQPRKEMKQETLAELAASIRMQGIIQPLLVRVKSDSCYEIIAGERRFRAAKLAGLTHVPCIVKALDDKEASAIALIENIQREDLNVMEEAQALERLIDEFSLTHQQIAEGLGKSRAAISNLLRLNSLEDEVKQMLFSHKLEMGHGRALLALNTQQQVEAAKIAAEKKFTVRQTEVLVKKMQSPNSAVIDPEPFAALQTRLSAKLGADVALTQKANGKGKIVISFKQKEKLEQILALFDESL